MLTRNPPRDEFLIGPIFLTADIFEPLEANITYDKPNGRLILAATLAPTYQSFKRRRPLLGAVAGTRYSGGGIETGGIETSTRDHAQHALRIEEWWSLRGICDLLVPSAIAARQSATMTHMEIVGIREMRQNLSRYTRRARSGESFVITDRGQAVAQLTPAPGRTSVIDRLVAERGARRGQDNLLDVLEELPEPIAGPPSETVLDELRSERW